jgi:hypothetical protein
MTYGARPTYTIIDARTPSRVSHLAVDPYFPLLALMVGGGWIGWPWFILNAVALGSYTRKREIVVCAATAALLPAATLGIGYLFGYGLVARVALPYLQLLLTFIKLSVGYFVSSWQDRAVALRAGYESPLRNGVGFVVLAGYLHIKIDAVFDDHSRSLAAQIVHLVMMAGN